MRLEPGDEYFWGLEFLKFGLWREQSACEGEILSKGEQE